MLYRKLIIALFDGGAGAQGGGQGSSGSVAEQGGEAAHRAKSLGLPDDMVESYQAAFGGGSADEPAEDDGATEEAAEEVSPDERWNELISGEFKSQYNSALSKAVTDRLKSSKTEIANLKTKLGQSDELFALLGKKYPDAAAGGLDALIKAVKNDESTWQQDAMNEGIGVDEAMRRYDDSRKFSNLEDQLNAYKQQEAVRNLDRRLNALADETKEKYPDFDLQSEFENPDFRAALDFIAEQNKRSGKQGEIFDVTKAYEIAHFGELTQNTVKSTAKATISAVAQDIAAKGKRPVENASAHSAPGKSKGIADMSDEEFDELVRGICDGRAKIPG